MRIKAKLDYISMEWNKIIVRAREQKLKLGARSTCNGVRGALVSKEQFDGYALVEVGTTSRYGLYIF